ncbi:DUF6503 family protein [Galbibacter sp. BG1]
MNVKHFSLIIFITVLCVACAQKEDAASIINKTIQASGMKNLNKKHVSFDFRDKKYESYHDNGKFELKRIIQDSVTTTDIITNTGFTRLIDGREVVLADSTKNKYKNSVNSVHYFAYLPNGLDGQAVNKKLLGEATIKGVSYFKIKVWFDQEGGGEDFEDVFIYWVNKETFKTDYLAYEYHVNEGGMRFREAYNRRVIKGIDFVDYNNYKPVSKASKLIELDSLFDAGKLELLSKIELENVTVKE